MSVKSLSLSVQLSIYTALQPNAEGGHTLIHKEDQFDVNSKFERLGLLLYCTSGDVSYVIVSSQDTWTLK